jgi:hypothetical protein
MSFISKIFKRNKDGHLIKKSKYFSSTWYRKQYPDAPRFGTSKHYLKEGWKKGYNPGEHFDGNFYLEIYPDVMRAGMNPLVHYIKYGKRENRTILGVFLYSQFFLDNYSWQEEQSIDVLLIAGEAKESGTTFCRIEYLKKELAISGITFACEYVTELSDKFASFVRSAKVILFNRPSFQKQTILSAIIGYVENSKKYLIFDIDDNLQSTHASDQGGYLSGYVKEIVSVETGQVLCTVPYNHANCVSVSTDYLRQNIKNLYPEKLVVLRKNVIPREIIDLEFVKPVQKDSFNIIYSSGSNSHLYDCSLVLPDIITFLSKHKEANLICLGKTGVSNLLISKFGRRIISHSFMDIKAMFEIYKQGDICIVPLDKNPFNEAKSSIKFIESAQAGIPVLVTDVFEFKAIIKDGENGFLTDNENFAEKLEQIFALWQERKLSQIGATARQYCLNNMTCESNADNELIRTIKNILEGK